MIAYETKRQDMKRNIYLLLFLLAPVVLAFLQVSPHLESLLVALAIYVGIVLVWVRFSVKGICEKIQAALVAAIFSPVSFCLLFLMGSEFNKAYWDSHVRGLCENKGGITVYEVALVSVKEKTNLRLTSSGPCG
ncbi:hypothetical protein [Microbulbifer sp. TYP-18]|uniref:hypothetical protein n=1 Tax=Microbulbifer sp. TYP-18 TaxID=3230024 RepID=UPI0034C5FC03